MAEYRVPSIGHHSWQPPVEDKDLTAPPGSPAKGVRYIVGPSATGAWATHDDKIAWYNGSSWQFDTPSDGWQVYIKDENSYYQYYSGSWGLLIEDISEITGEPTGFPNRTDSELTFYDGVTRTVRISPTGSSFDFYVSGQKYTKTSYVDIQFGDTEGIHYIYFNSSGVGTSTQNFTRDLYFNTVIIALVYWDDTNSEFVLATDERHGLTMPGSTQYFLHKNVGTKWESGLEPGNFSGDDATPTDASGRFSLTAGYILDEDLLFDIDAHGTTDSIPVLYRNSSGYWRLKSSPDEFPVIPSTGTRLAFNEWTGAVWTQTEVAEDGYVVAHIFALNDMRESASIQIASLVAVQGQREYGSVAAARNGAYNELGILLDGLPSFEMAPIMSIIYQTSSTYTGSSIYARVRTLSNGKDYVDLRGKSSVFYLTEDGESSVPTGLFLDDTYIVGPDSHTGDTNWEEEATINLSGLSAGRYRIGFYLEWAFSHATKRPKFQVEVDNTTQIFYFEPTAAVSYNIGDDAPWYHITGFAHVTLTAGNHHIDLDFGTTDSGQTVYVQNSRLEVLNVGS